MSSMECSRNGCTNVLCDRYSKKFGYICNDCFTELINQNLISIEDFMKSIKQIDSEKYKEIWKMIVSTEFEVFEK
jgi:hypothetical protein